MVSYLDQQTWDILKMFYKRPAPVKNLRICKNPGFDLMYCYTCHAVFTCKQNFHDKLSEICLVVIIGYLVKKNQASDYGLHKETWFVSLMLNGSERS